MTDYAKPDSLPFRSYYAQQRRKKRKAANALVQRYITSLSAAGGMYYLLNDSVVIGAGEDFEVELFANCSTPNTPSMLLGNSLGTSSSLFLNAQDLVVMDIDNSQLLTSGDAVPSDSAVKIVVKREGSLTKVITPNGEFSNSIVTGSFIFEYIGRRSDGFNFTGEIYDLKIWTGGDRNTGALVLDMPIDEDWTRGTVVHNRAADLGVELVNINAISDGSTGVATASISTDGEFILTRTDAGNVGRLDQIITTVAGRSYLYSVENISNSFGIRAGNTLGGSELLDKNLTGSGQHLLIFTATSSTTFINVRSTTNGDIAKGKAWSLKEIPSGYPFATAVNVTENEADLYTLINDGTAWQSDTRTIPIAGGV